MAIFAVENAKLKGIFSLNFLVNGRNTSALSSKSIKAHEFLPSFRNVEKQTASTMELYH